jgi:hypothetical protein
MPSDGGWMNEEFSARKVATEVVIALERRREAIAGDPAEVGAEVERALAQLREAYRESALPMSYFAALENEIRQTLPARWRPLAAAFDALERRGFGSWRGGDVYARVVYVFAGLALGGICVALPFIPIWEKWFPFALALAGWWLPDAQASWHRRRYGRELGRIVQAVAERQLVLEARVSLQELSQPDDRDDSSGAKACR